MAHLKAVELICEATSYDLSEVDISDDAFTLDLWDSIAHVNVIMAVEELIGRPLKTDEIIEMSSVTGIQNVIDAAGAK